ncbi:MAG TPA: dienelactone hydrolase family protein [Pseudonocardia sp.]|jgi:carboxymethylenebutenolidase|nr:dienelactone hydrolase family protein [Pseudonocardia sp.]
MQSDVTFRCDDGLVMPGVLTTPDGEPGAPRPGLLMIYEAFGMNDEMTRVAADLAGEGWTVLIPDLFARGRKPLCVARCIKTVATGQGVALDDLEAARRYLAALPGVDAERIGAIGFCMGGGFALLLAMTGKYQASAPFYGMAPKRMPQSCPVVASYGGKDVSLKGAPARLSGNLVQLGVPHDVKTYPEAGHSFYTQLPNRVLEVVGAPLSLGWHAPSAQDARERVVAFFREHLDG